MDGIGEGIGNLISVGIGVIAVLGATIGVLLYLLTRKGEK